jgi:hypothetical protein
MSYNSGRRTQDEASRASVEDLVGLYRWFDGFHNRVR